jgi:hypothetical protein
MSWQKRERRGRRKRGEERKERTKRRILTSFSFLLQML